MARQTSATIFAVFVAVTLLAPAQYLGAEPKAQRGSQRARKIVPTPLPILPAEQAWIVTLSAAPSAGGAMDAQRVYVPLQSNQLHALDRKTGKVVWQTEVATIWPPVARDGLVYVAGNDAIHAFDAETGAPRWKTPIDRPLIVALVAVGDLLVAVAEPDTVLTVASSDGHEVWKKSLGVYPSHPPSSDGGRLAFSLSNNRVVTLNLADGAVLWEQAAPGDLSPPVLVHDRLFVGSSDNYLYAFDERGRLAWKWRTGGDIVGVTVDSKGSAYHTSLDNVLRAVNQGNGNQRWIAELPTRPTLPPQTFGDGVVYEEVVVITGITSELHAFSTKTGSSVGTHSPPSDMLGYPLVDGAIRPYEVAIVIVTRDGRALGLTPTAMLLAEPKMNPLDDLPGRHLDRDRPR